MNKITKEKMQHQVEAAARCLDGNLAEICRRTLRANRGDFVVRLGASYKDVPTGQYMRGYTGPGAIQETRREYTGEIGVSCKFGRVTREVIRLLRSRGADAIDDPIVDCTTKVTYQAK